MEHISLHSNNHNSSLVNSLDHFKAVNSFVDVTLVCEGHTVKAHKVVLSAGSNVLHRLMLANPAKHPIVILTETKYDTLRMIMDFLYKGRIDVSRSDLKKLLTTAVTFEMNELRRLCEEHLSSQSQRTDIEPSSSRPLEPSGSSPKKKRHRRQSTDSDILFDAISPKREISSPCGLEEPEVSMLSGTPPTTGFRPQIAEARSLNRTPMESVTVRDTTDENIQRRDASTECDIQPLKELESNLVPIEPARVTVRTRTTLPRYNEKSDDSESDLQNKQMLSERRRSTDSLNNRVLSKRRRSTVWEYFTAVNSSYAMCKLCQAKLSYKTTVTNLTKHLRTKHRQFDPKHPPKLPDVPLMRIQNEQLEIFEDVDFNFAEDETTAEDEEQPQHEEALDEGIPSTSTPFILKIT